MNNFFVIVLDGVGVGELPDAAFYGDEGSNTLGNMSTILGGMDLPNLQKLGLGNIIPIKGVNPENNPAASFGKMCEHSKGKDSTTGHWELGGLLIDKDFDYFPNGFPDSMMDLFLKETGCKGFLGNKAASGTEIIKELGEEHIKTGFPIVYTSADSVFQIAAHEDYFGLEKLFQVCEVTRTRVLKSPLNVGRVIARPFIGEKGSFVRTTNRKDYSLDPPSETILDLAQKNGIKTVAIGKINDLFNYRGIDEKVKTKSNTEGCEQILNYSRKTDRSFIFTNLVDFDVYFGHRNDPGGFYNALREFDDFLPEFLSQLDVTDRVIITSDHGNDPTTVSTDHSREYVPLLYYGNEKRNTDLGIRKTFSDVAKTVAEFFSIKNDLKGISFLKD